MLAFAPEFDDIEAPDRPRRHITQPWVDRTDCAQAADDSRFEAPGEAHREGGPGQLKRSSVGRRILVVEDEASARRGYGLILGAEGYEVIAVATAEAGLARLGRDDVDLVLSDVNLPGMDGFALTSAIRQRDGGEDLPVVLVSAVGGPRRRVTGLDAGADDFMEKPVDVDELLARIRAHLRRAVRSRELERRSMRDPLTGLLNRAALEDELARELKRMSRTGLPVSLVMIDLDRFKEINDRHGHLVGDEALRRVAIKLEAIVRETDRVGRFGGDEFLVVLPDTSEEQMQELVERLRLAWRRHPPMVPQAPQPIMASFGGATANPGDPIEAVVRAADAAMYRDKRSSFR